MNDCASRRCYAARVPHRSNAQGPRRPRSTAFLIAQIGAHAAKRFGEALGPVELLPAHAGILRVVATSAGISQQELSALLGMLPSRLVPLLDELEQRGLIERRDNEQDRRLYALHLTDKGTKTMADIGRIARAHDDDICAALTANEREQLGALLGRIADEQGLTPGVHPGFAKLGTKSRSKPEESDRIATEEPRGRRGKGR
jgi:DNA-binding MarR family transcriptional regulator